MSLPRTPANFPRMKHRARKRTRYRGAERLGWLPGVPTLLDDGLVVRLWDKDWNLVATARTHS